MVIGIGSSYSEPEWHDHIPRERAELYYKTIKELLELTDKDLKNKSFPELDKELLEILKERLTTL